MAHTNFNDYLEYLTLTLRATVSIQGRKYNYTDQQQLLNISEVCVICKHKFFNELPASTAELVMDKKHSYWR
jgi:hypothetical protein